MSLKLFQTIKKPIQKSTGAGHVDARARIPMARYSRGPAPTGLRGGSRSPVSLLEIYSNPSDISYGPVDIEIDQHFITVDLPVPTRPGGQRILSEGSSGQSGEISATVVEHEQIADRVARFAQLRRARPCSATGSRRSRVQNPIF